MTTCFTIPSFIYDVIKKEHENERGVIASHEERIKQIINEINERNEKGRRSKEEWSFVDCEETMKDSGVLEADIEDSLISNLDLLEEGLQLIGRQYQTDVGYIDILCRDKNGNVVVVELKRDAASPCVGGSMLTYMSWVAENLAGDNKEGRGIIVVKESNEGLNYAVKGFKYNINIKECGHVPPTKDNINYCDFCGNPNQKSTRHCRKCGQKIWR